MTVLLPTLAIAFAAFCVWLTVRIVNRRERWAKWTLAAAVGVPVLYVASFGPACGLVGHGVAPPTILESIFRPCLDLALDGPEVIQKPFWYWSGIWGGSRALFDVGIARDDVADERFIEEIERGKPPTFRVVGIMSDGERDIVDEGLTLEMAEAAVEYILRTKLRDEAVVEPE